MDLRIEDIQAIIERLLPDATYFVVDIKVTGKRGSEKVVVLVDGDEGISINVCAKIARSLSEELDTMNMFEGSYTLEVSSPGVDYPLVTERQYVKNLGRQLKIDLVSGDKVKGDLLEANASGITLTVDTGKKKEKENLLIPFSDIKRSKVLVTFK